MKLFTVHYLLILTAFVLCLAAVKSESSLRNSAESARILDHNTSAAAGNGNDDEEEVDGPFYILKHDAHDETSIFAEASNSYDGLYRNPDIIPCTLEQPEIGRPFIQCNNEQIQLHLPIFIFYETGKIDYTDAFGHVVPIVPNILHDNSTDQILSHGEENTDQSNSQHDDNTVKMSNGVVYGFQSPFVIVAISVVGGLTALFFVYCTCCCCVGLDDYDDSSPNTWKRQKTNDKSEHDAETVYSDFDDRSQRKAAQKLTLYDVDLG